MIDSLIKENMDRKIPLGVNSSSSKEGGSRAALRKKNNSNKKRNLTEYQTDTSEADIGRDYHGKLKTKKNLVIISKLKIGEKIAFNKRSGLLKLHTPSLGTYRSLVSSS